MTRHRNTLFVSLALVGFFWLGCSSSDNGDAVIDDGGSIQNNDNGSDGQSDDGQTTGGDTPGSSTFPNKLSVQGKENRMDGHRFPVTDFRGCFEPAARVGPFDGLIDDRERVIVAVAADV